MTIKNEKARIEYCPNGTKLNWFVDAWIGGGWKNVSSYATEEEAIQAKNEIEKS